MTDLPRKTSCTRQPARAGRGILLAGGMALTLAVPAHGDELSPLCGAKIAASGFPRASQDLAEISAIGNWLEAAGRINPKYAIWHRAEGKAIKCEKIGTIGRISCAVVARPCIEATGAQAAMAQEK